MKQINTTKIEVLLTAAQKKKIAKAAAADGRSMSAWMLQAAMIRIEYLESARAFTYCEEDIITKQRKITKIEVLLTAAQKKRISKAAKEDGRSMSSWMRHAAMLRVEYLECAIGFTKGGK